MIDGQMSGTGQLCHLTSAAEQTAYFDANKVILPYCQCSNQLSSFADYTWSATMGAAVAVQFAPNLSSGAYTISGKSLGLSDDLSRQNVQANVDASSASSEIISGVGNVAPLQIVLDAALIGQPISISGGFFPQNAYTVFNMSSVTMLPLYSILICAYGLVSITAELCKETKAGLRHGLFMIGLDPFTYWISWIRMMCYRMIPQVLCLFLISKLLIIVQIDGWLLILTLIMYVAWLMLLCIFLGLMAVDPDSCSLVLVAGTSLLSSLTYLFLSYFYNSGFIPPIPSWGLYVLAYCFPPFAMGMIICCAMYYTSIGEPLNLGSALSDTPFGCTTAGMIVALATSIAIMAVVVFYLIKKTTGIAKSRKSSEGESMRLSTANNLKDLENNPSVAVSIKGMSKYFTRQDGTTNKAVDGLTVDFYEGQITSFLGHNGAGKSTAISLLTGLFLPDSGDAFIRGHSVKHDMASIRPLIGVCPQTNILWDLLSCRDHMELFARIRNIPDVQSKSEIDVLLRDIGLLDKADTFAKDLSGGQKRKLQTAIALIGDPPVIFLDEPTAGMDSSARRDMWDILLKKKKGKAIILCTHQMDEADILGDRVAVVSAGHLQEAGSPAFLKAKWGKGVRLDMTVTAGANRTAIMADMRRGSGGAFCRYDLLVVLDLHIAFAFDLHVIFHILTFFLSTTDINP